MGPVDRVNKTARLNCGEPPASITNRHDRSFSVYAGYLVTQAGSQHRLACLVAAPPPHRRVSFN